MASLKCRNWCVWPGEVVKDLDRRELLSSYQAAFSQQLADDIIEEIDVHPDDYHRFIWIPHRPVVKTDANTTTKIRPVFNCSLKTNKAPSLNELSCICRCKPNERHS